MKEFMIVDDSAVVRRVASRILSGAQSYVREAGNGHQALEICAVDMPDIVIVNWILPDMSALDFIAELRAISGEAPLPRIAVWLVETDVAAIMRAKRAGAVGFLLKPFTRNQLLDGLLRIEAVPIPSPRNGAALQQD